jgi:hypothetical protein
MFYGIIYHETLWGKALIGIGAIITLSSLIGWGMEPLEEPHGSGHEDHEEIDMVEEGSPDG